MKNARVSYVITSFNHEEYIETFLRSLLNQTYTDFEAVLIDDGSTDETFLRAESVAATDTRLRVYRQQNAGVMASRARGLESTTAELVSIVDADDLLPRERTKWMVQALEEEEDASMVYGDALLIDCDGRPFRRFFEVYPPIAGEFSVELFANYCFVPGTSVMFRRSALERTGPFRKPAANSDYLKWIELGLEGSVVCLRDKQLSHWRIHGCNMSSAPLSRRAAVYTELRNGLQDLARRHPALAARIGERRLRTRFGRCHFMGGFYSGYGGYWPEARRQFAQAFRLAPSLLNAAAWASTTPVVNLLSQYIYRLAARWKKLW